MPYLQIRAAVSALAFGVALACVAPAHATTPTQQAGASNAILMQGFHWNSPNYSSPNWYVNLANNAADMKSLGITHVWFPPPSDSGDTNGYLPRQLSVLSNKYGTEAELKAATAAFAAQGIKSVADIVINHRVGTTSWGDFTNPTWDCHSVVTGDEWSGACGASDTGNSYGSARDLDHTNSQVSSGIPTWMAQLKAAGFTGLRYDYSLGYRGQLQANYTNAFAPDFCVGEVWTTLSLSNIDAHRQILMNYISGDGTACTGNDATCGTGNGSTCGSFDFTTHGLLIEALANNNYGVLKDSSGKPAGAIGWWPAMQVTFVDNHDTGPAESCGTGQNLWSIPCASVMQAYAYILTHPGIPTIFYPHVYNWGLRSSILPLVQARTSMGVNSTSAVSIQSATTGLYAAIITGTKGSIAMKIGAGSWTPSGTGWTLATSGTNYAVWTNGTGGGGSTTVTTKINVHYDVGSGNTMYLRGSVSPLSWTAGVAETWTTGNVWTYSTTAIPSGDAFEYKALINDTQWSDGANYSGTGGSTLDIYPTFNGNFYDIMDTISTNWAVTGGTTAQKWVQGTSSGNGFAQCSGCSTESQLTLKNSLIKNGTVTLAFKYKLTGLVSGDYLAVDVLKGSTWYQVASLTGTTSAATNVSYDISRYASSALKVRFRAKMTTTAKIATVDNVTVSVK